MQGGDPYYKDADTVPDFPSVTKPEQYDGLHGAGLQIPPVPAHEVCGSPTEPDSLESFVTSQELDEWTLTLSEEGSIQCLIEYLRREVLKVRAYRALPVYLFLLATITAIPWMSRLSNSRYNELYHLERANQVELGMESFMEVDDVDTFWSWYRNLVEHTYDLGNQTGRLRQSANFPVGYLLLRQYRVKHDACAVPAVLKESMGGKIPARCHREWGDAPPESAAFGPNGEWTPGSAISVMAVDTMFHDYDDESEAYVVAFSLDETLPAALVNVSYLEEHKWLDQSTRVVIIDVLTFNPSIDAFALNHFFIEFFATGSTVAGWKAYPFDLLHFSTRSLRFAFAADVVLVVGAVYLIVNICCAVLHRRQLLCGLPLALWDAYDVVFVVFVGHCAYYRMFLWANGPGLHDGGSKGRAAMFSSLFDYGYHFERSNTFVGITVFLAWIRLFRFLQYNSRLGVLSDTVNHAKGDLIAMFAIFLIVLIGYGIGGSALYGVDHENFSSTWNSMSYLLRLLISAEVDMYFGELRKIHPDWTGFFFASYMVITWVILLNMILAIITGAFVAVQEQNKVIHEELSLASLAKEARKQYARIRYGRRAKGVGLPGFCTVRTELVRSLFNMGGILRAAAESDEDGKEVKDPAISLSGWLNLARHSLTVHQALKIFHKAKTMLPTRRRSLSEKKLVNTLVEDVKELKRTLSAISGKLDALQPTPDSQQQPHQQQHQQQQQQQQQHPSSNSLPPSPLKQARGHRNGGSSTSPRPRSPTNPPSLGAAPRPAQAAAAPECPSFSSSCKRAVVSPPRTRGNNLNASSFFKDSKGPAPVITSHPLHSPRRGSVSSVNEVPSFQRKRSVSSGSDGSGRYDSPAPGGSDAPLLSPSRAAAGLCAHQACVRPVECDFHGEPHEYCSEHLCGICWGPKAGGQHQVLCAVCEANPLRADVNKRAPGRAAARPRSRNWGSTSFVPIDGLVPQRHGVDSRPSSPVNRFKRLHSLDASTKALLDPMPPTLPNPLHR
ncbi:Polycystin-2 [Diplonema papillatum]|nr:Polycystin-2 [Diplonema papillatum]